MIRRTSSYFLITFYVNLIKAKLKHDWCLYPNIVFMKTPLFEVASQEGKGAFDE